MEPKTYTILTSKETTVEMNREEIHQLVEGLRCGCPNQILDVIDSICRLIDEQSLCILKNPSGFVVHSWLVNEAMRFERDGLQLLSELLQKEGVL
jgi:hypothetical protein